MNRISILAAIFFLLAVLLHPQTAMENQNIDELISQIQTSLTEKNISKFLEAFSAELRSEEELRLSGALDRLQIDTVSLYKVFTQMKNENEARIFLRVLYENSYAVTFEIWQLDLLKEKDYWLIKNKGIVGDVKTLYRLQIPSGRVERAKLVEVKHADFEMFFEDALVFYDNLPDIETALLVVGKGRMRFSPSVPKEKHQLEMIFKKRVLEDRLEHAYLRFSNSFFGKNIRIVKDERNNKPLSEVENNRAYSLFKKYYSNSFTVENSINGELVSFLPQGESAAFDFKGVNIGDFSYIYSPFAQDEITLYQRKKERIVNLYSPQIDGNKRKMFISLSQKFDVEDYDIEINYNPKEYYLSGKAQISARSEVDFLDVMKFKLNPNLEVLEIRDINQRKLFYTRDRLRKTLYVYLLYPPKKDEKISIDVYYRGAIKPLRTISDVITGPQYYEEAVFFTQPKYNTYLYSKRSLWYPAPSSDYDYFTARIKIIVPPRFEVVSHGRLVERSKMENLDRVEEIEKIGSIVSIFEMKDPVKYLSFITGKFLKAKESKDDVPIIFFRSEEVRPQRLNIFEESLKILRFYESIFGPYPYEKLSIVKRPWKTSGGHSPASFIVLNELPKNPRGSRFVNVDSPVDLSRWKEYFLAHEIAHQWWGQCVTWKNYQDQWISEGIAQFAALLYLKDKYGPKNFRLILKKISRWAEKKADWGSITLGARISYFDIEAYQAIVYNKSSLVLNMLKDIIGEELFFKGLKEFFSRFKFSAASTNDFFKFFQDVADKDLTAFFEKWFNSFLLPDARISYSVDKVENQYILNINVAQHRGLFVFPLWLEWRENGSTEQRKILVEKMNQKYQFILKEKPGRVVFNPDRAVPGRIR